MDGGSDRLARTVTVRGGERWRDSSYMLKSLLAGLPERLGMVCDEFYMLC